MTRALAGLLVCACGPAGRGAAAPAADVEAGVDVAVYATGLTRSEALASGSAIVVERRRVRLRAGPGELAIADVPDTLEPGSVSVRSMSDPAGTRVLGQRFEGAAPALRWQLDVARGGPHVLELVYTARRLGWWMDYGLTVDLRDRPPTVAIDGWATVANESSLAAPDATLQLVAGVGDTADAVVWRIDRPVSVAPRSTLQLAILAPGPARIARVEHRFDPLGTGPLGGQPTDQYVGTVSASHIDAHVVFVAAQALPAGMARVMIRRPGMIEPVDIGAVELAAAHVGDSVRVRLGRSRHLVGSRRQLAYNHDFATKRINEAVVIRVRNDGREPARVVVSDRLYRALRVAVVNAHPTPALAGRRVEQVLTIAPGQAREASYEAVYTLE